MGKARRPTASYARIATMSKVSLIGDAKQVSLRCPPASKQSSTAYPVTFTEIKIDRVAGKSLTCR